MRMQDSGSSTTLSLFTTPRFAGVVEVSTQSFCTGNTIPEERAVFLSHDLNMLRLIETFSESSPQLVLMLTIIIHRGVLEPITGELNHGEPLLSFFNHNTLLNKQTECDNLCFYSQY